MHSDLTEFGTFVRNRSRGLQTEQPCPNLAETDVDRGARVANVAYQRPSAAANDRS